MTVQAWNEVAAHWADHVWRAGIAVLVATVLVTLVWRLLKRWASAHFGYALFLVPLMLLVLPWPPITGFTFPDVVRVGTIEEVWPGLLGTARENASVASSEVASSIHGAGSEPRSAEPESGNGSNPATSDSQGTAIVDADRTEDRGAGATSGAWPLTGSTLDGSLDPGVAARGPGGSLAGKLLLVWLALVTVLLIRFSIVQVRTHAIVRSARDLDVRSLPKGVREAIRPLVRDGTRLTESDAIQSPAAWGIFRPTLVMPTGLTQELEPGELRWVLCHELAHLGRHDVAVASVQRIVQILWFFHPVVWIVGRQVDRLRECACDEAALARCRAGSRRGFAEALVRLAERPELRIVSTLPVQGLLGPKSLLETRILRMLNTRRNAHSGLNWLSAPALLLVGTTSILAANLTLASPEQSGRPWEHGRPAVEKAAVERADTEPAPTEKQRTEKAIAEGLAYLEATQAEDGGWYAGRAAQEVGSNDAFTPVKDSGEFNRAGITGLAISAFVEAGQKQRPAVGRAIDWLRGQQDEDGCFGGTVGFLFNPSHCVATLAWLDFHAGSEDPEVIAVAQRATDYLHRTRNPYRGWRYSKHPDGDNDSFVTSLAMRTLLKAKAFGCEVERDALIGGLDWLEDMTSSETGRCGYNVRGGPVSRIQATAKTHPVEYTEMLTAMAILVRLDLDQDPLDSKVIRDGALLVAKAAPLWDELRGSVDYYHWMYGTDALQKLGGFHWNHWKKLLDGALLPNQEEDGSWRAIDAWSSKGSTVHATAVNTLTLAMSAR
tara:strand:- start:2842 stop:5172 length:2331 start_codon:yes stop_codon:yes gene_type:complete